MIDVLDHTDVICLAMNNGDYPYIVPINFGYELTYNNQFIFYIHGAKISTKVKLIKQNPLFSFELDAGHQLITNEKACKYSFDYASVIDNGMQPLLKNLPQKWQRYN